MYDTLRPRLIYEGNIDSLCELVDILKVEVLGEQLSRRGESIAGLRPILQRILADVHERLAFCSRTHIREEVSFCVHILSNDYVFPSPFYFLAATHMVALYLSPYIVRALFLGIQIKCHVKLCCCT